MSAVEDLLSPPAVWLDEGVSAWWVHAAKIASVSEPRDMALALGARSDRLAYAFAGGYLAALRSLLPDADPTRTAALCATEAGGARPTAIETNFASGCVTGDKTFVTLASQAEVLYVLVKEGDASDGRARLAVVAVESAAAGVGLTPLPQLPFVPEIGHASVRFDGVPGERLPGDGWNDYVRPFRTIEDVHVHLAFLAWQLASFRRWGAADSGFERGLGLVRAFRDLALSDPSAPATHLGLAGTISATESYTASLDWRLAPADERERWERDRPLLKIASKARELRRVRAWERVRTAAAAATSP